MLDLREERKESILHGAGTKDLVESSDVWPGTREPGIDSTCRGADHTHTPQHCHPLRHRSQQLTSHSETAVIQQITAINAQPIWLLLLQAAWGRFWSFPLQVALSVMVLQVFRRRQMYWLFLAILLHALIDFLSSALPHAFGQSIPIELLVSGILCVFGLLGIWIIWRLREPDDQG